MAMPAARPDQKSDDAGRSSSSWPCLITAAWTTRARGGLRAQEHAGGGERTWQVLGASRGEGGILGEGVRQAHLRDPTYGPALAAAQRLCA